MSTPAIVINGTSGAYEQPIRFGTDASGPYFERTWSGTAAAIAAQYNSCIAAGCVAEIKSGFGTHTVVARYSTSYGGGTEVPVDSWEFFASHVEKDMLEADNSTINGISDDDKRKIRDAIANPNPDTAPTLSGDALSVYLLMLSGVRAIRVNAPILRHTQTVSNIYTVKAALTNVGSILSSGTLATFESIPSSVLFNLPYNTSTRTGLDYGWMVMHPTIRTAARQKMQIEREYEYGLWATLLYGSPL